MNYDFIICTTAVTRPDLHLSIFTRYVQFLADVPCKWLINVNTIGKESIHKTVDQLNKIINRPNIDLTIYESEEGGSRKDFYTSCQFLIEESIKSRSQVNKGVFWLEDDWNYIDTKTNIVQILNSIEFGDKDYIQLVKRIDKTTLSFNPGIWGWELFMEVCYTGIQKPFTDKNNNPERACVYPTEEKEMLLRNKYNYPVFEDAGRKWQRTNNLNRTFKLK